MAFPRRLLILSAASACFAGCGRTDLDSEYDLQSYGGSPYATGGSPPIAGTAATGGHIFIAGAASTGGYRATGGAKAATGGVYFSTGGRVSTGGVKATGGVTATGGKVAIGGSPPTTTGGTRPSSSATGGVTPIAGSKATGGTAGTGGVSRMSGGTSATLGGTSATAGTGGVGGVKPTGGTPATGGTTFTGGTTSTGGSSACPSYTLPNEELIDDMDDGSAAIPTISGRRGAWSDLLIDTNGASIVPDPSVAFFVTDTGDICRKYAVYVHGMTSIDPGSGANFGFSLGSPYNASGYTGLSFWAKIDAGTDPPVRVTFPDGDTDPRGAVCQENTTDPTLTCWSHFGFRLVLTSTWTKYTIPFSSLTQDPWGYQAAAFDPTTLYSVTFAIGDTDTFGIWVDSVAFTL